MTPAQTKSAAREIDMMRLNTLLLAVLSFAPLAAAARAAEELAKPNAALRYWPVCVRFQSPARSEADRKIIHNPMTAPLENETERVLRSCANYLREMHRGAAMPHCEWQLDWSRGPDTTLLPLDFVRPLAGVFLLRARYFLSKRQSDFAADDLADAITVGRHLAIEGAVPGVLVQLQFQSNAVRVTADNFDRFDRAGLALLASRLDALPSARKARDELPLSKEHLLGWLRTNLATNGIVSSREVLLRAQFEKSECELLDEFLSGTQDEVLGRVADAERIYDLAAELLELPADQFDAAYSALEKEAEAAGPLTAYWLRDTRVKIMRDREVEAEAKMTMLRAALAMAADGSGALERFPDPFGDGPFALTRDDESFELKSKLVIDRKPVQLRFRRPLP